MAFENRNNSINEKINDFFENWYLIHDMPDGSFTSDYYLNEIDNWNYILNIIGNV